MRVLFVQHSPKIEAAWPRMTPHEQAMVVEMHQVYERTFKLHSGWQAEDVAVAVHEAVDRYVAELMASHPKADQVQCRRGCSHCCRVHVTITANEAALLHHAAHEAGVELDRDRLQRQAAHGMGNWGQQPEPDQACVFLDVGGSCTVYEHRPSVCRIYFALSPPEQCDAQKNPGGKVSNFVSIKAEIVSSAAMRVFERGSMPAMLLKHGDAAEAPAEPRT